MTLNLNKDEMNALEELVEIQGLNKTAVLKQALSLYQIINYRIRRGEKIYFEDKNKEKSELVII